MILKFRTGKRRPRKWSPPSPLVASPTATEAPAAALYDTPDSLAAPSKKVGIISSSALVMAGPSLNIGKKGDMTPILNMFLKNRSPKTRVGSLCSLMVLVPPLGRKLDGCQKALRKKGNQDRTSVHLRGFFLVHVCCC